jgi:hypothetical protein
MASLRRTDVLLLLGMLGGAVLAARGLVLEGPAARPAMPRDAVAVVNGEPVSRSSFDTAVGLVERDRGGAVTAAEKHRILQRLVDEELLVQRGLELGLPRSDRKLRGDLVAGVIDAATAGAASGEPTAEDLAAFFETRREHFAPPVPLRVAQVFVARGPRSEAEASARADAAARRLRDGEDLARVRGELGDPPAVEIPSSFVPATRLRDTVGPSAAAIAQRLGAGEVSDPLRGEDGYRVLVVLERGESAPASLEAVRADVLAEYQRQRSEADLRDYLDQLRKSSHITLGLREGTAEGAERR